MKLAKLTTLVLVASLAACSSIKSNVNSDEPIRNQTLTTKFTDEGVKIITDCRWYKPWQDECEIVAIEASSSTWTNGNSPAVVSEARRVARAEAFSHVSNFINKQISSTQVTQTIAKHVEKARDQVNTGGPDESEMTDKEAKSLSSRENSNDTARTVTRTITENSQAVLRGFKVIKEEKIGQQEIAVTIRWDKESDRAAKFLRKQFGG